MKNWIKNWKNQYLAFNITILSLPLLLLGTCSMLSGSVLIGIWLIGILMSFWMWNKIK